jgi:hypothetical protein
VAIGIPGADRCASARNDAVPHALAKAVSRGLRPAAAGVAIAHDPGMSHKVVQSLIGQLLTDAEMRARFLSAPLDTLLAWRECGVDLTDTEVEGLLRIERGFWDAAAARIDPSLQRWRPRTH